ncbi:hypothetical protein Lalb_Chr22g0356461 [Lupinus albus]|uniref:Uncharacterized protein n=1 Tax=Lupinus albus TaxID=3870 RepID=A0A6A4NCM9_LUPAL|nr:hypothetical protein Lalb_Chr22g0356461 [Lupinus albus]
MDELEVELHLGLLELQLELAVLPIITTWNITATCRSCSSTATTCEKDYEIYPPIEVEILHNQCLEFTQYHQNLIKTEALSCLGCWSSSKKCYVCSNCLPSCGKQDTSDKQQYKERGWFVR